MAEAEGVLGRWARRKQEVREGKLEESAQEAKRPAEAEKPSAAECPELPDIESLDAESDFSVFMSDGVPEAIQRLALRRLWRLDPVLANLDGLVDYGEDFTDAATVIEGMKTAYRVGKGIVGDEDEEEEENEVEEIGSEEAVAAGGKDGDIDESDIRIAEQADDEEDSEHIGEGDGELA